MQLSFHISHSNHQSFLFLRPSLKKTIYSSILSFSPSYPEHSDHQSYLLLHPSLIIVIINLSSFSVLPWTYWSSVHSPTLSFPEHTDHQSFLFLRPNQNILIINSSYFSFLPLKIWSLIFPSFSERCNSSSFMLPSLNLVIINLHSLSWALWS